MTTMGVLNEWFEGLERAKVYEEHLCDKCGLGSHGDFPGAKWLEYHFAGKCIQASEDDMNSLQLLVIDLGAYCVVKVESKQGTTSINGTQGRLLMEGEVEIFRKPFDQLKAALDDAPVPRIENAGDADSAYYLITDKDEPYNPLWLRDKMHMLYRHELDALSQLAGHPLPIWAGGKWEQIYPTYNVAIHRISDTECVEPPINEMPSFRAWRYTR